MNNQYDSYRGAIFAQRRRLRELKIRFLIVFWSGCGVMLVKSFKTISISLALPLFIIGVGLLFSFIIHVTNNTFIGKTEKLIIKNSYRGNIIREFLNAMPYPFSFNPIGKLPKAYITHFKSPQYSEIKSDCLITMSINDCDITFSSVVLRKGFSAVFRGMYVVLTNCMCPITKLEIIVRHSYPETDFTITQKNRNYYISIPIHSGLFFIDNSSKEVDFSGINHDLTMVAGLANLIETFPATQ